MRSIPFYRLATIALCAVAAHTQAVAATHPELPGRPDFVATVLPRSVDVDLRTLPVVPDWKPGDPFFLVEDERFEPKGLPPRAPVPRRDPLLDVQAHAPAPSARAFTSPLVNFAGMTTGAQPPDTTGDVSADHYIQMVNGAGARFTVYRKSDGAILSGPTNLSSL